MTRWRAPLLQPGSWVRVAACPMIWLAIISTCRASDAAGGGMARRPEALSREAALTVHVHEAAQRFGITEAWIRAVMRVESAGQAHAVSPVGAMGLMQIMPATWSDLSARYGLGSDPFEMRANIMAGAAYLRAMLDRYGDLESMLAAYNAGPRRVDDWRAGLRALPAETIAYVARIAPALHNTGSEFAALPHPVPPDWRKAVLFAHGPLEAQSSGAASVDTDPPLSTSTGKAMPAAHKAEGRTSLFIPLSGSTGR